VQIKFLNNKLGLQTMPTICPEKKLVKDVCLFHIRKKKIHLADLKAFNIAEEINNLLVSLHSQWISTFFEESCAHFFSGSCKVNLFLLRPWRRMAKVDLGGRTEKVEVFWVLQRSGTLAFQNESHIPSFPELLKADQFNDKDHLLQMEDVVSEFR